MFTEFGPNVISPKSTNCECHPTMDNGEEFHRLCKCRDTVEDCIDNCMEVDCTIACAEDASRKSKRGKSIFCNSVSQLVWGVLLIFMSIGGFIFTPLDVMLWEKLNMRPGFPPFDWWADPPDEVKLRVYIFNVTNHERFLAGLDSKINVEEVGPIVYLEKLLHSNMRFNENSTLTYTATRIPIYLPDLNAIDLNSTVIVPNIAVLGICSYLHDAPFFVRTAFNLLVKSYGSSLFVRRSIQEFLWDFRDPVLATSRNLAPGLVPVTNMGILARIYSNFKDDVTVTIGPEWGHRNFFRIDRFQGDPQLPGYDPDRCPDRIIGSTEGVMYHQHIEKEDVLLYWRKTVCKLMPLYFDKEMIVDDLPVYRFNLSESVFERVKNGTDCYDTVPSLPAGVSDASKCFYDFPLAASFPHFYAGGLDKNVYVTGLQPDSDRHNSYVIVEPATGIPFRSVARMQSNLRIHDLSGFSGDYQKFSGLILPLIWAEYNQEGLPKKVRWTIYFMKMILPPLSAVVFTATLLLGCYLIGKQIYVQKLHEDSLNSMFLLKKVQIDTLATNKLMRERDTFMKNKK